MVEPPKPTPGADEPQAVPGFQPLRPRRTRKKKARKRPPETTFAPDAADALPEFLPLAGGKAGKKARSQLQATVLFHDSEAGPLLGRALTNDRDSKRLPLSASMRRLGPRLLDALTAGPGLFLVIGEAGLGKSAFLARIAAELRETSRPVIVPPAPGFAADSLLQSLTSALGIPVPVAKKAAWLRALHAALDRDGTPAPILLVDDADLLREEALLVLVAPLEATQGSAAGIRRVRCGRPVLRDRIERPALVRLRRHMRFAGELEPYGEADLRPLLIGLRPGGAVPPPAPSREVVARVLAYSAGRP